MTQEELINQIKEARKEFLDKDPCKHCEITWYCDDCRICEDVHLRHELTSKIFKLKEEFKKLYNVDYDDFVKLQKLYSEHPLNKEDLLLLYKDLCGRTTYGTKIKWGHDSVFTFDNNHCGIGLIDIETSPKIILSGCYYGDNIRPYLFPLSSMTEEQKEEYNSLCEVCTNDWGNDMYFDTIDSIDWLNKNHFDFRNLIPKGIAIDATGLNIY
jgi:hypothetical protein